MIKILHIPVLFGLSIEVYFLLFCIAIPTYFFWKWLFRRYNFDITKRNMAAWASTLILTPIIYVGFIVTFMFLVTREPSIAFDKSKWLEGKEGRFEMGDDIVKSNIVIGKDTNQVKQLLGQPTWQDTSNLHWTYNMGFGGGFGFLLHNLSVSFDKNKVIKVEHHRIED
jgi:hypothetical protein